VTPQAQDMRIWLASGSPRRRDLLAQMGLNPVVRVADVAEVPRPDESPDGYARRLAREKGRAVRETLEDPPGWIVAADTVVVLDGRILEKPADEAEAIAMLTALSGREHQVITAYWAGAVATQVEETEAVTTAVRFRELSAAEIRAYVASGEPMDKAGGYGIQGKAGVFVSRIEGSYFNVVGLPIAELFVTLRDLGALAEMESP
jgi:septum formation protein